MSRQLYMVYLTLKEAAEATGLNEATIRRLCKRSDSKPFIQMKESKRGAQYTIQSNYLFSIYSPAKSNNKQHYTRLDDNTNRVDIKPTQDYTLVITAKDELIQSLKSENSYLREENKSLREENKELKFLPPAPMQSPSLSEQPTNKIYLILTIILFISILAIGLYVLFKL